MASDVSVDYAALQQLSLATFERELPALLIERPGEWVAYRGDQRLGIARTRTELHRQCVGHGMHVDEFLICCIEPYEDEYWMGVELDEPSVDEDVNDGLGPPAVIQRDQGLKENGHGE